MKLLAKKILLLGWATLVFGLSGPYVCAQTASASPKAEASSNAASTNIGVFRDQYTRHVERRVLGALARKKMWDGPTAGPLANQGKTVVYIAADLRNGGVSGVANGMSEACLVIGWHCQVWDGQGSIEVRTLAFQKALKANVDGVVLGGFDANEQSIALKEANRKKISVVGWHSSGTAAGAPGLFYNVATNSQDVAEATALYAVLESRGNAGIVIMTDSTYSIALAKSDAMARIVKNCRGCTLLGIENIPMANAAQLMPSLTTGLMQKYGAQWTHTLAINDVYFDFMKPTLEAAGFHPMNLSAGDGSTTAYERIRKYQFQAGTVPEPLNLHGWQIVDELNRAMSGTAPSGYNTPVHLVTPQTILFDGGQNNNFDPDNGYRTEYKKIWFRR